MKRVLIVLAIMMSLLLAAGPVLANNGNGNGPPFPPPGLDDLENSHNWFEYEEGDRPGQYFGRLKNPIKNDDWEITSLWFEYDQDPLISYGIAVMDFGAPSAFSFSFVTPIIPVVGPNAVTGSASFSVTDGGDGAVTLTALNPPGFVPVDGDANIEFQVATVFDAAWANIGRDVGLSQGFGGGSSSSPPYNEAGAGPVSWIGWNQLRIDLNFQLSGGGDIATMNGSASINPVPEPTTLLLVGAGLVALGFIRYRKH